MTSTDTCFRAVVCSRTDLSPSLVRIRLGGGDLPDFASSGVPDERLVVTFPGGQDRSYTVRAWDAHRHELTIDFVRHSGGVAGRWAAQVALGDEVLVTQAMGWYAPPSDARWQLLIADLTGLPALGRIVESLAGGTRAHVIAEVLDPADRQVLSSDGSVSVRWLVGSGNGRGRSGLLEALTGFAPPAGPGYVWFAGEAADSRGVRRYLRRDLGWTADRYTTLGYWRRDKERWDARYGEVGPTLEHVYHEAVAAGQSSADALELYDDALDEAGL